MRTPIMDWRKTVAAGDTLSAGRWNGLVGFVTRSQVHPGGVVNPYSGIAVRPRLAHVTVGAPAAAAATFARITSRAGREPPYRYTAKPAHMDIDGNWTTDEAAPRFPNVFNMEEQGASGQWGNPLVIGDVVMLFPAPATTPINAWVAVRSHYRGTY